MLRQREGFTKKAGLEQLKLLQINFFWLSGLAPGLRAESRRIFTQGFRCLRLTFEVDELASLQVPRHARDKHCPEVAKRSKSLLWLMC